MRGNKEGTQESQASRVILTLSLFNGSWRNNLSYFQSILGGGLKGELREQRDSELTSSTRKKPGA